MKKILILFAHPAFQKSRINKTLLEAIKNLEGVTINNLYEKYPDFFIDVPAEQKLLSQHDVIVWHHPFYWYSAPALIKEWMDLVLQHGYAYGTHGRALEGKWAMQCISSGGSKAVYSAEGKNHYTVNEFLAPFNQSATLCRMNYLPPFVVHGSHLLGAAELKKHAEDYRAVIELLRDSKINPDLFNSIEYINEIIEQNA
ncbi:NAD(P)H-dependent oxidoreductase [Draconibacterium sp. IB214405]|uniref:glutathione-regulated potassium-efflux system oxidoreductase KefF n=1 Tax=Draconibacterium sp. IB214405 TaxID=3097352 RepID=UPI002A14BFB3|nr:NAD(P)H-dependent oxidoreductase [Draconibacterium sp. IB214405]MDX8339140.1 NAD(P)H-dependent oxidoreductase [Draconibacterium sp. IB214405]